MPLQIIRNDITKVKADAIVNTANPMPAYGNGTDCAIYKAAGEDKLLAEREKIGEIARGEVAVTPAFALKAKYIIHTVGPRWDGGGKGEFDTLKSCYRKSLEKALELSCETVAFPLISAGSYGFPKSEALQVAVSEIGAFLMRDDVDMLVTLVVFDDSVFRLSKNLFMEVEAFISDEDIIQAHLDEYGISNSDYIPYRNRHLREVRELLKPRVYYDEITSGNTFDEFSFNAEEFMNDGKAEMSFQNHLLKLIIEKNMDNSEVYKSSNVTKGAFSKILCGDTKVPKKKAVLGFCIGLKLSLEEAKELLASADMAFNPYDKRDKLIIQCIEHGKYDVHEINEMLYVCNQPLLGN